MSLQEVAGSHPRVPDGFERCVRDVLEIAPTVPGFLTSREIRFLALLAACPTADGVIVEIGSFRGKSAVVLARAARLAGRPVRVVAVDPLTSPSVTDPAAAADAATALAELRGHLDRAGVSGEVEFHQALSHELAAGFTRPVRLLWIDGDHTTEGARRDLELFLPHLADGAVVALHDVLNPFDGPVRVTCEQLLLSDHFGPAGLCGSIAWAQWFRDPARAAPFRAAKRRLHERLARVVPWVSEGAPRGWKRLRWKWARARVPHAEADPVRWTRGVLLSE